ncbi:MAG: hypothetical protein IJ466_11920 [Clostridia bacterium]|nr:hypothetical protein [Clostridia bacterium]
MNTILEQKEIYHEVNSITGSAGSIIFGEERFAGLPVSELVQDFGLNISVCNRSLERGTIADAFDLLGECVFELNPRKVFLNFGETDMEREDFDIRRFLEDYARLVGEIRGGCSCRVFIVPVLSEDARAAELNGALCTLAKETGSIFVDTGDIFRHEKPRLRLFSELMHYMRESRISFTEAMGAY